MSGSQISKLLTGARDVQRDLDELTLPHPVIGTGQRNLVVDHNLFNKTRGYIEKVVTQINITYQNACYDACAVMIRRLIETLIIEVYESRGISSKIKNQSGDFLHLRDLISAFTSESSWNVSRNSKRSLDALKDIGDKSAHNRYFNAQRKDIDDVKADIRNVSQELLYLANIK